MPPFRTDDWPVLESFNLTEELEQEHRSAWYKMLDEIDPAFYQNDKLRAVDYRDWTIRRCNESRLGKAEQVSGQLTQMMRDARLRESVDG